MKTILILEDEPAVMNIIRAVLKDYTILNAVSAEEALRLFHDQDQGIDLLLADVTLPVGSGVEVAVALRRAKPELPIVLMSGYPPCLWEVDDWRDFERLNQCHLTTLQKPFSPEKLVNSVQSVLCREEVFQYGRGNVARREG